MVIVADSSPLICFAIIDKIELLDKIFDELMIPEEVYQEVGVIDKPYSNQLRAYLKDKLVKVENTLAVEMLTLELDKGEAEAIVLALEKKIKNILIDDFRGRKIARKKGLIPIGTIGVLLLAKKKKYISEVKPYMYILIDNGIRISKVLYEKALELAGEE